MGDVVINEDAPVSEVRYRSYSAFTNWTKCGKAFELKRIARVPDMPAVWLVGGNAFHRTTENYDRARVEAGNP